MLDYEIAEGDIHVGPSDYVPWLKDRKWCHIRIEGTTFGDVPLNAELKLEVWDSPNSAGVIIDAIRCLRIGLDRGLKGTLVAPSSYFMKSPPLQIHDDIAHQPRRGVHPGRGQRDARRHRGVHARTSKALAAMAKGRPPPSGDPAGPASSRRPTGASSPPPPRLVEKAAVVGYRSAAAVLALRAAARSSRAGRSARPRRRSYLAWPAKRRPSNANFGHVLGLPPER